MDEKTMSRQQVKFDMIRAIERCRDKTNAMPSDGLSEVAIRLGRMQVISEFLDDVNCI